MSEVMRRALSEAMARLRDINPDFRFDAARGIRVAVPGAREALEAAARLIEPAFRWRDCYGPLAEWLEDNHSRGLLLMGTCGTGKTLLMQAACGLILACGRRVVTMASSVRMNARSEELLGKAGGMLYIDDVGRECEAREYGNRQMVFADLADEAERRGGLLMASTNLGFEQLSARYGERTADRLRAITRPIVFTGGSARRQ